MTDRPEPVLRRVAVLAALSLATDLDMALPFEHGLRATLIAVRLADALGLDPAERARTFELCLLYYLGCTADAADVAGLFGDDVAVHRRVAPVAFGTPGQIARAAEGNGVVTLEHRFTGTHTAPLTMPDGATVPPTGRSIAFEACTVVHTEDGVIRSWHAYFDQMTLAAQLGLLAADRLRP